MTVDMMNFRDFVEKNPDADLLRDRDLERISASCTILQDSIPQARR